MATRLSAAAQSASADAATALLDAGLMATKVVVPYAHDPADLQIIHLAITTGERPPADAWKPALRDTIGGKRVVWARFPSSGRRVTAWIRGRDGERSAGAQTV